MNKVFQLVWNHFSRTWVAAGETAKRNTKGRYAVDGILAALAALGVGISSAKPKAKNSQAFGLSCMTVALAMAQGGMVYAATPAPTALPTGAQIAAGQANIVQQNNTLTVQQQTDKLITNWQSFDIGSQATVNFQQPSSNSVALNRITNQDPTQILGNLNANGQIFLLNPAGIIIGNEAQVNVNTLVATTLSMTDQDFLDENYALTGDPNSLSKIVNQGTITTPEGGRVALIAPVVENQGDIITPDGSTALAAASEVELDLSGQGTLGIRIDKGTLNALVENQQLIQANNGQVILTARAVDALTKSVVNNDGIIEATSLTSKGGRIVLEGDDINLGSNTTIDASGETGGGEVLIGGDWQGSGDMHQAETVTMDAGAEIHADAITQGDGGKVVLWSDINNTSSLTEVHGEITARGGAQGGDGGEIETSGAHLNTDGIDINAGSVTGESGDWLIDPYDYTVDSTAAANITNALNNSTNVTLTTASDVANYGSNGNSASNGNVTISSAITATTGNADFKVEAAGSVYINANITTFGDLYIKAADAIDQSGSSVISTNGGNVVFWSNSDNSAVDHDYIRTGAINTDGGHVWLGGSGTKTGSVTWHGMTVGAGYATSSSWDGVALRNNIDTRSSADQTIGGDVWIAGESGVSTGADIGSEGAVRDIQTGDGDITLAPFSLVLQGTSNYQTNLHTTGQISIVPISGADWWSSIGIVKFDGVMNTTWFEGSHNFDGMHINNFANIGGLNIGTYPGTGVNGDSAYVAANQRDLQINAPIDISGPISAYANTIWVQGDLDTRDASSAANITLKSRGFIATNTNFDYYTDGGDITLWANSVGTTSGTANNEIVIGIGSILSSNGGDITLAGGADDGATAGTVANDGIPDHYAYRGNYNGGGVYINENATFDSNGGNIIMRGQGVGTSNPYGVQTGESFKIDSGTGKIIIDGKASTNDGILFGSYSSTGTGPNYAISSANTSSNAISITGLTTDTTKYGITLTGSFDTAGSFLIQSTATTGGGINITGTSSGSHAILLDGHVNSTYQILSTDGSINITGNGASGGAHGAYLQGQVYIGQRGSATAVQGITPSVTSSTADITVTTDHKTTFSGGHTRFTTQGDITLRSASITIGSAGTINTEGNIVIESHGDDFTGALDLSNLTISGVPSSLRIGKSATSADGTSDVDVTFAGGTIGGDISIYAREIDLTGTITKNAGNEANLLFKASNNVSIIGDITASSDKLNVILWSDADGNGDGRVYIGNNITTNGGGVWVGGSYSSHGDGTSWTPYTGGTAITVGDGYATTPNNANSAIYAPSGTITTAGGHITMYGYSNDDVGSGNYGINLKGLNLDSAAGNIILEGVANSAETASTFAFGTYIHSGSNVTSTSGNISLTGTLGSASQFVKGSGIYIGSSAETTTATGDVEITSTTGSITITGSGESTGTGSDWRYGNVLYPRITDTLTIGSTSGHITISGEGNFHNVTSTGGLTLQTSATTAQLNITSRTGNISLTGSSTQESTAAEHALRFISYNASNNIRVGYDGANTYSGDITVKANSIYNTYNNSGSGSLAFITSGDVFIRPEDGDTSFSKALDINDDWNFGSGATSITIGTSTNTADISVDTAIIMPGSFSLYGGNLSVASINTSASTASSDVLIKARDNLTVSGNITTNNNNIVLWSDADGANGGYIALADNVTLNSANGSTTQTTGGGHIVLAGGTASTGGLPTGHANSSSTSGITLGTTTANSSVFYSGGGDILLKGKTTASSSYGIYHYVGMTMDAGEGAITFTGESSTNYGISLSSQAQGTINITSAKTSGTAISITGTTTAANSIGVAFNWQGAKTLAATGGGAINVTGTGTGTSYGVWMSTVNLLASSGNIDVNGGTRGIRLSDSSTFGKMTNSSVTSSSSNITLTGNELLVASATTFDTSGTVSIQPIADDFSSDVSITDLTVSAATFTLGKNTKSADGTNDVNFTLASADITTVNALTLAGKNVTFSGSATTTAANADIQVLATGNITNAAGSTFTTGSSSVTGGKVILASNIDDATDNDTTTNGYINMRHGIVINTHGGDITIGGGDTAGSGYAYGGNFHNGTSYPYAEGVRFDTTFRLDSAGGDIAIRGKSYPVTVTTGYGAAGIGLYSLGANSLIDSGTGTIDITGYSHTAGSTYSSGIITHSSSGHGLSITSANTTANAIVIKGIATGTSGDAWGMEFNTDLSVTATGTGGGINILTSQQRGNYDIVYRGDVEILAKTGAINLKGGQTLEGSAGLGDGYFYKYASFDIGSKASSAVTSSSSDITIEYDKYTWAAGGSPSIATSGDLLWQSASASFGQGINSNWFNINQNGHTLGNYTFGRSSNTANFTINGDITSNGD